MKKSIGIIGFGNMGQAIAEGIKAEFTVLIFDKDTLKTKDASGMNIAASITDLMQKAENVILAVKPQDLDSLFNEIKKESREKLIISIAAGITTGYIERMLPDARVVRAMPNIGAKIGNSVTCLCKGKTATDDDLYFAQGLFQLIGKTQGLDEAMMNAATAICGSGPGYYFDAINSRMQDYQNNHKKFHDDFILSLAEAAEHIGFDQQTAAFLASWTIVYSDLLLKQTKLSPQELKKQVTSKGGTTEAALEVLHSGGTLVEAVKAAVNRAKELSRR